MITLLWGNMLSIYLEQRKKGLTIGDYLEREEERFPSTPYELARALQMLKPGLCYVLRENTRTLTRSD